MRNLIIILLIISQLISVTCCYAIGAPGAIIAASVASNAAVAESARLKSIKISQISSSSNDEIPKGILECTVDYKSIHDGYDINGCGGVSFERYFQIYKPDYATKILSLIYIGNNTVYIYYN